LPELEGHTVHSCALPELALSASDHRCLEAIALVAAAQGDIEGLFLLAEISRAQTVPRDAGALGSVVAMGSWATFWIDWGFPRETRQLVYPKDYRCDRTQVSVMSPLGAALIGLRCGSQMPFSVGRRRHLVRVDGVSRTELNVIPLFRAPSTGQRKPLDDDPGPSAA
jgi:regulator of nucleoside diphosphate kinase